MMIHFKGSPLNLAGRIIRVGSAAPPFRVISQDLKEITIDDFKGKVKILTSFPSLDTPVCDMQVKEFNKRAIGLSKDLVIIGISKDLPFAQARFCHDNDIKNISVFSDYRFSSFGLNYGLLIKELNLLARSVIIADKNDSVRYIQVVDELTTPPDYDDLLANLKDVLRNPAGSMKEVERSRCKPCELGAAPLARRDIDKLLAQSPGWQLIEDKKISKEFKFKDFAGGKYFVDAVSVIAEDQGHHPTMTIAYNKVKIALTTHAAGGLTENDFIMAKIIDDIMQ